MTNKLADPINDPMICSITSGLRSVIDFLAACKSGHRVVDRVRLLVDQVAAPLARFVKLLVLGWPSKHTSDVYLLYVISVRVTCAYLIYM